MGRISAPFGIKGWIRVQAYADSADSLRQYTTWWLSNTGGSAGGWQACAIEEAQCQGADVVAKLAGCDDRDLAASYKGRVVAVPREAFPPAKKGEFYWADLVGLSVTNVEGLDFGVVQSMLETGANAVMVVRARDSGAAGNDKADKAGSADRLIPFIAQVVKRVDLAAGVIEVDWGADY